MEIESNIEKGCCCNFRIFHHGIYLNFVLKFGTKNDSIELKRFLSKYLKEDNLMFRYTESVILDSIIYEDNTIEFFISGTALKFPNSILFLPHFQKIIDFLNGL